jgi:hypothetical protein
MQKVKIGLLLSLLLLPQGASAGWFGSSNETKARALLQVFKIMLDNGAYASGAKGESLTQFVVWDFNGDLHQHEPSMPPECLYSAKDSNGDRKSFRVTGESCKTMVEKLHEAGFGQAGDGFADVTYIGCMLSLDSSNGIVRGCEATQPLFK